MTRQRDRRKSGFITVETSEAGDYFDFVRNGQNFRITQSDLIDDFGVTGSIVSVGDSTAIPVLSKVASVNNIRALLGGSGISTSISPSNGITIKHNLEVDKGGVPIMINEAGIQPTLVSLEGGSGISVGASGKSIQIALSATPPSTKTVIIYEESDFPEAVGDLITLEADTYYLLVADISTVNRLTFQEGTILAGSDYIITLTYTGVGIFLNMADVNCKLTNISLVANTGTLFGASSSDNSHFFRAFLCNFQCDTIGLFSDLAAVIFETCNFLNVITEGFSFDGSLRLAVFNLVGITLPSGAGSAWDLGTATFDYFCIDQALIELYTTGYSLKGLPDSGNINIGGLGIVTKSFNFGTSDCCSNIYFYDDRWEFQMNPRIPNSLDVLLATHSSDTIAISVIDTPVVIGDTWLEVEAHRFDSVVGGRFTYKGKGSHVSITASISGAAATATHTYSFYVYINGIQEAGSIVTREFSTDPGNVSLIWEKLLSTDDYVEIFVENNTGTADFDVSAITLRLKGS